MKRHSRSRQCRHSHCESFDRAARFESSIVDMLVGRRALFSLLFAVLPACGGPTSRLVTLRTGTGNSALEFSVKNQSDAPVNALYIAKTERVNAAGQNLDYDSPQGAALWGADLLTHSGIAAGHSVQVDVPPGTWDVRVLDNLRRYQHITGLHLRAGGRYVLELNDGGWRK